MPDMPTWYQRTARGSQLDGRGGVGHDGPGCGRSRGFWHITLSDRLGTPCPEEVDLAIPHLCADEDGLCGVRVELGETPGTFNSLGQGAEVASLTWEPLVVVHQEHPVHLSCGRSDWRDVAAGFVPPDFPVDAVCHARHRAPLPRGGS